MEPSGSEPCFFDYDQAIIDAEDRGQEIIECAGNMMQFDFDSPEDVVRFEEKFKFVERFFKDDKTLRTTSRNKGIHLYLVFRGYISDLERLLLQACLGSDRNRELYSYVRWKVQCRPGKETLLFESPEEAARVRAFIEDYNKEEERAASQIATADDVPF